VRSRPIGLSQLVADDASVIRNGQDAQEVLDLLDLEGSGSAS
jgi:hypothetical protein